MPANPETPASTRSITYENKEYEAIREGLADILIPPNFKDNPSSNGNSQTVFYNPIQQFNRDLSVLVIRAFAEDLAIIRQLRKQREKRKASVNPHKG